MRSLRPIFIAFILSLSFQIPGIAVDTIDRILVIVNDEIITESDLNQVLVPIIARLRATTTVDTELQAKIEEARSYFLKQMVEDRLVVSAANDTAIEVEQSEVDEMMADMRKKFPTQEVFENVLREQGISFKELRERFRNDILKRRMIDYKVRSRVSVSPGDVLDYYTAHEGDFKGAREARVRQILIRTGSTRSAAEARDMAVSLVEKLSEGADMAELAREYSEGVEAQAGGAMGWIKEGQFMERIDRPIFKLQIGEHTQPIKTQLGYHIFNVEDAEEAKPLSFDDVRNDIHKNLYRMETEVLLREWLQELHENAYVAYQG